MVLDIRQVDDEPQQAVSEEVESTPQLEDLLTAAAEGETLAQRAGAVEQLRHLVPGTSGTKLLWSVMDQPGDSRRLVVAQLLGYHRRWISSAPAIERLLATIRSESDTEVAGALVWGLRQKDEIQEFLFRDQPAVAREAALGLPINSATMGSLISYLFAGQENENRRILLEKLRTVDPRLVKELVCLILEEDVSESAEDTLHALFQELPQVPLFNVVIEGNGPERALDHPERDRAWRRLVRTCEQVLEASPGPELLRFLFDRSSEEERFARRHARFVDAVLLRADRFVGPDFLKHIERLTNHASEEKIARLAQLLVDLGNRLSGSAGEQAAELLESWKHRSAALKLKIYHMQQGLS
jgi:hypothetical protein